MDAKPRVYVNSLDEIPFDTIAVDQEYILANGTPAIKAEAEARLLASPIAIGRRPVVASAFGTGTALRVVIWPAKPVKKDPNALRAPPGRPRGVLAIGLEALQVGEFWIQDPNGKAQQMRNTAVRVGKRLNRKYSVETPGIHDSRVDWTLTNLRPGELMLITRKT